MALQRDTVHSLAIEKEIKEITILENRPSKSLASSPLQIFTKEDIQQLSVQNVSDAVKTFSGVTVKDYGGIGGIKTVSIRGMGAQHTAVSYDGIIISNYESGQIDIGRYSLDNVESLTLSIGQSENMLQSAKAYASMGILNINTKKPSFNENRKYTISAKMLVGSFGQINPNLNYSRLLNKNSSISFFNSYTYADGNYPFTYKNGNSTISSKRRNSSVKNYNSQADYFYKFNSNSKIRAKAYYYDSNNELPGNIILYRDDNNDKLKTQNYFLQTKFNSRLNNKLTLASCLKYNHSYLQYRNFQSLYGGKEKKDFSKQNEYYLSSTLLFKLNNIYSLAYAQDGIISNYETNDYQCPFPTRYTSLSVLSAKANLKRITINAHILNTFISETVKNGIASDNIERFSPSLSLSYKPFGNKNIRLRTLLKKSFRAPNFSDLYFPSIGSTTLKPEDANEYNLGFTWNGKPYKNIGFTTLSVDGYINNVKNKIVAFPTTNVWKMRNFGKVNIYGLDLNLASNIPFIYGNSLKVNLSYSYQKALNMTDKSSTNYKDQIPYTPLNSGTFSTLFTNKLFNFSYNLFATDKRYSSYQNSSQYKINAYLDHSIAISKNITIKDMNTFFKIECLNLTNKQYEVVKYYPMPGISYKISMNIKY